MFDALTEELRQKGAVRFYVRAVPGAAKTEAVDLLEDGSVKIRIAAAPEGGKANVALTTFLARVFSVPKHCVRIVSGHAARVKLVHVTAAP